MDDSLTLGRVAGVPIGINWSVLVALALIVWTLATGLFPTVDPGLSDAAYVTMGLMAAIAYFGSILLHELGHALVARREGVPVSGITLWIFGGVAKGAVQFPSARAELRIALAGPVVSLGIGLVLSLIAWAAALPAAVDGVIAWLGFTNLALLAFNIVPALPLDGGRVLRAALWQRWDDFVRATRVAAAIGRGFGRLLIAGGLAMLIFVDPFSGAWFVFLGWFVRWAAEAEGRAAREPGLIVGPVSDVDFSSPPSVGPRDTLARFVDEVAPRGRSAAYPVLHEGRPVGLLPLAVLTEVPMRDWERRRVDEVMLGAPALPVVELGDDAAHVLRRMRDLGADSTLVRDDGRVVGVLTLGDLARALAGPTPRRRG
jgi:Zn-dependent protease/CBS domain-containing protein